jgi:hypothetical protein
MLFKNLLADVITAQRNDPASHAIAFYTGSYITHTATDHLQRDRWLQHKVANT